MLSLDKTIRQHLESIKRNPQSTDGVVSTHLLKLIEPEIKRWISIEDRIPLPRAMVLVFTSECLITQAYFSGTSFHAPWGDEYPGSKQPKYWMPLPNPPYNPE